MLKMSLGDYFSSNNMTLGDRYHEKLGLEVK